MKEVKQWKKELKEKVLQKIDYGREMTDREVEDIIDEVMLEEEFVQVCPVSIRQRIRKELFDSMRRLDILQMFVDDPSITEIMINGKDCLFIEREGRLEEMNIKFESTEKLQQVIQQIVAGCNRMVNEASPIVDARLENGARVNIVMNPVALDGPAVTIRRFPEKPITMEDLIHRHSLSKESAAFLKMLVQARYNIFISGGTGSGKTTMLNVLSGYVTGGERVITIEDNAELQLQGIRNLVRLEVRNSNVEGCREISIRDLIKTSLRMRPEAIHNEIVSYKVTKRVSPSHTHSLSTDLTMAFFSSAENASKFSRRCTISFFLSLALRSSRAAMRSSAARDRCSAFKD